MTLNYSSILDQVSSHAGGLGIFDAVNTYEPKSAPGNGIVAAVMAQSIQPIPEASSLSSTTGLVTLLIRLYTNFAGEPAGDIDTTLMTAADLLMTEYSGDFQLTGNVRNVDLLGAFSDGLSARWGFIDLDNKKYRAVDVLLPLVVNDLWNQVA